MAASFLPESSQLDKHNERMSEREKKDKEVEKEQEGREGDE
jgi:hypothetical protein